MDCRDPANRPQGSVALIGDTRFEKTALREKMAAVLGLNDFPNDFPVRIVQELFMSRLTATAGPF